MKIVKKQLYSVFYFLFYSLKSRFMVKILIHNPTNLSQGFLIWMEIGPGRLDITMSCQLGHLIELLGLVHQVG